MQTSPKTHAIIKFLTTKKMRKLAFRYITDTQTFIRRAARKASLFSNGKHAPVRIHKLQHNDYPTFFGYYDKTPFSRDESKILATALTVKNDWRRSSILHPLKLGYFNTADVEPGTHVFKEFGKTQTWSWQQGCMLQWFPSDPDRYVVYNCLLKEKYGSVIQDVFTGEIVQKIAAPLYTLDPEGQYGVGLNFSRLERLRPGYGYVNFRDTTEGQHCPDDDGLWSIDIKSGKQELMLSLQHLASVSPLESMQHAVHYVNHLMVSPDGSRFIFLHVWLPDAGNTDRRRSRLMCFDLSGNTYYLVDDSAIVTHYDWLNGREILATRLHPSAGWEYVIYELGSGGGVRYRLVDYSVPDKDGHPSLSPSGDRIVTDMEDEYGELHPLLIDVKNNSVFDLGGFYRPRRYYDAVRCDLHPRWDRSGKRICFDSAHEGKRAMYLAYVNE